MGCSNSKNKQDDDLGFDWWLLCDRQNWRGVGKLLKAFPDTARLCQHKENDTTPHSMSGHLLLHRLCKEQGSPTSLIKSVLAANPGACAVQDATGNLPLHHAALLPAVHEVITLLLTPENQGSPAACKCTNSFGSTPLHLICHHTQLASVSELEDIIGLMIEADSNNTVSPAGVRDFGGKTPLDIAVESGGQDDILLLLLTACPEGALSSNGGYGSMLHWACAKARSARLIEMVCTYTPSACNTVDDKGDLPIHTALFRSK